jgi:hypothetical protein
VDRTPGSSEVAGGGGVAGPTLLEIANIVFFIFRIPLSFIFILFYCIHPPCASSPRERRRVACKHNLERQFNGNGVGGREQPITRCLQVRSYIVQAS